MLTLRYLGHSCFTACDGDHTIIFDPFLSANPLAACGPEEIDAEAVLTSHGHGDHLGDTEALAKRLGCPVIAGNELARYLEDRGCQAAAMHIGGARTFDFGTVKLTQAVHGSGVKTAQGWDYVGPATGFLVTMGGISVYFAGDTGLFGDMRLIGDSTALDVALLPIGDCYTMGPTDAVLAAELLRPRLVIPMHYNTFDLIKQDVAGFCADLAASGIECAPLIPGESITLNPEP